MIRQLRHIIKALLWEMRVFAKINGQYPLRFSRSRVRSLLPEKVENQIGSGVTIEGDVLISSNLQSLGEYVYVGRYTEIQACECIGNYCSISRNVKIGLLNHPQDLLSTSPYFYQQRKGWVKQDLYDERELGMCEIGHDVLISANVVVLGGVKIGTGAIIGAGSVVLQDIPPYAIAVGSPAKVVRYRFEPEQINRLIASRWWEVPPTILQEWQGDFGDPVAIATRAQAYHQNIAATHPQPPIHG